LATLKQILVVLQQPNNQKGNNKQQRQKIVLQLEEVSTEIFAHQISFLAHVFNFRHCKTLLPASWGRREKGKWI